MRWFWQTDSWRLSRLAKKYGAEYLELEKEASIAAPYALYARRFEERMAERAPYAPIVLALVEKRLEGAVPSSVAIPAWYDIEYASAAMIRDMSRQIFPDTDTHPLQGMEFDSHYEFLNLLLTPQGFSRITGFQPGSLSGKRIIDIGSGTGQLLRFIQGHSHARNTDLIAIDISQTSAALASHLGFVSCHGHPDAFMQHEAAADLLFLSYFIEYDARQRSTFAAAIAFAKPGSTVVFEGWLPSRRFASYAWDQDQAEMVTRGTDAADDAALIIRELEAQAQARGKRFHVTRIFVAHRYVYSEYGLSTLPSIFIVGRIVLN